MISLARRSRQVAALVLTCLGLTSLPAEAEMVRLRGAGATFPAPLYYRWMEIYGKDRPDLVISYDAVGSGDGISRFVAGSVDFGATDALPGEADIARVASGALMVPATAGMVVLAYNLPGLGGSLKLSREVYVDILRGTITRWNDPRIARSNPSLQLPARTIALVARLDRSGTTSALTAHLSMVSPAWRATSGTSSLVEWPASTMLARGNEGVAARVKISEGSIGYVEYGFAKRLGLSMAELENKSGRFVTATDRSGQTALAEGVAAAADRLPAAVTDPAGSEAYPIVTYSWLLLYRQYAEAAKQAALRDFIAWGLAEGQAQGSALGYLPLPESAIQRGKAALDTLRR